MDGSTHIECRADDARNECEALTARIANCKAALVETLCAHGMLRDSRLASERFDDLLDDMTGKEARELARDADEAEGLATFAERRAM